MTENEATIAIFDGHNDTILDIADGSRTFLDRTEEGHIDLPRAREGGLAGGFFAVFVMSPDMPDDPDKAFEMFERTETMPPMMSTEFAAADAVRLMGRLLRLERESDGACRIVRSAADLRQTLADGVFAIELHFEGAEPIDTDLEMLETYYAAGLRSLGLVWSRPNRFGHGVPFTFPSSPDTGPGLTDAGKRLVRACNRLGIMLDISHLNEKGFWDLAGITDKPIVATHCGAHAISPTARNLTDKQLDAIRDSDGLVGVNFHVGFLRPDGKSDAESTAATGVGAIADHTDYLVNRIGIDRVALGSDFDGATMPGELKDAAGLPKLIKELRRRGYDDQALRKIGTENWLRIFDQTWR